MAATIATVEARHAAYLNGLNGDVPFPDAVDEAKSPRDIATTVAAFINSCDDFRDLELPEKVELSGGFGRGDGSGRRRRRPVSNAGTVNTPMLLVPVALALFAFSM